MIAKLNAAQGTAATTSWCRPASTSRRWSQLGLLAELDLANIPNFTNIETQYTNQPWDPDNAPLGVQGLGFDRLDLGHRGDRTARSPRGTTSSRRRKARPAGRPPCWMRPATSAASTSGPTGSTGPPRTRPTWMRARTFIVNELAPHIKAFDSYPGIALDPGQLRAVSQAWNGDARQGLIQTEDKDPGRYKWGLGAPKTELWMDNWCILAEAENVNAAYAWINFILQPDELAEGPRVPRLQHRHQGRPGGGGRGQPPVPRRDLLRRGAGRHVRSRRRELGAPRPRSRSGTRPRRRPEPSAARRDQGRRGGE